MPYDLNIESNIHAPVFEFIKYVAKILLKCSEKSLILSLFVNMLNKLNDI